MCYSQGRHIGLDDIRNYIYYMEKYRDSSDNSNFWNDDNLVVF